MNRTPPQAEKAKPFRLVKYFTFTALVVIFLGALLLSYLNVHWMRSIQLKNSEAYALVLMENLNHQVFLQFIIPAAIKYGKIQLRDAEQFERMDKVVRSTLLSFPVERINIYDKNNVISYSFDKKMVGRTNVGGSDYLRAFRGETVSRLIEEGPRLPVLFGPPRKVRLVTYAPFRSERFIAGPEGPILGVVEIEQDLTANYQEIFAFQTRIIFTCAGIMGALFVILVIVVRKGEKIIAARVREELRLKEALARARHLSSLGELTAGISHEIRNPLGIIRSSAELLAKKMARLAPGNTIPAIIVEESNRLNNIITDFLNYARPRTPRPAPCQVTAVLEKNLAFLAAKLEKGNYRVQQNWPDFLPEIMADADMLYQAFLNILLNALQACPKGGLLKIGIENLGDGLQICFEDNGQGIAPENLETIWDPFFTTKQAGTGLGLGLVKNIIEAHNGRIAIANPAVQGVQVRITLPMK